jgi:hypothetical protein
VSAVLDRLEQISPKVLFADNAVEYNGKVHPSKAKMIEIIDRLRYRGLQNVVVFETVPGIEGSLDFGDLNQELLKAPEGNGTLTNGIHKVGLTVYSYDEFLTQWYVH